MLCIRPWYSVSESASISDCVVVWNTRPAAPTAASATSASQYHGASETDQGQAEEESRGADGPPRSFDDHTRAGHEEPGGDRAEPGDARHDAVARRADVVALVGQAGQQREVRKPITTTPIVVSATSPRPLFART